MRPLWHGLPALLLLATLSVGAIPGCASTDGDAASGAADVTAVSADQTFDVSDVSILFPIKNQVPYPQIRVSGISGPGSDPAPADKQLLPKAIFDQVIATASQNGITNRGEGNDDFTTLRGLWQIVGARFDPCAPGFDGDTCIVQLRLVAQPFTPDATADALVDDIGMHLIYNLASVPKASLASNATVRAAVQALGDIKAASTKLPKGSTAGQPLGVHPGLAAEATGNGSDVANAVRKLVQTFSDTPSRLAAIFGTDGAQPWSFVGGQVAAGRFTLVPAGPASPNPQVFGSRPDVGQGPDDADQPGSFVQPRGTAQASTTPFLLAGDKPSAAQKAAVFAVLDPKTASLPTTDCVSCHTAASSTSGLRGADLAGRVKVTKGLTGYVAKEAQQDSIWNVHNFSYFGSKPTVSDRTVNESVVVAGWLNQNVRAPGAGAAGPGPDCTAVDEAVWTCFHDGEPDCLAKCVAGAGAAANPPATSTSPAPPVVINPPGTKGDPCASASEGGAPAVNLEIMDSIGEVQVQLDGNDARCLSRLLSDSFFTTDSTVSSDCGTSGFTGGHCGIIMPHKTGSAVDQVVLTGAEKTRFEQFFHVKEGAFFASRGGPASLAIGCTADQCVIEAAASPASLTSLPGERVNP